MNHRKICMTIQWLTVKVPSGSGEVRLQKDNSLDFEVSPQIQLVVLADSGLQTAHCRVSITLVDVNDNSPLFEQSSYRTSVWEGQVHNTYIMQVKHYKCVISFIIIISGISLLIPSISYIWSRCLHPTLTAV